MFKDTWRLTDIDVQWLDGIEADNQDLWHIMKGVAGVHSKSMLSYLVYMYPRLAEMRRLLKPTGSIYLHCDPTASHYLKMIMDSLFGRTNYRNEIVWHYSNKWSNATKSFQKNHDVILFYAGAEHVASPPKVVSESKAAILEKGYQYNRPSGTRQLIVYDRAKAESAIAKQDYDKLVFREGDNGTPVADVWTDIFSLGSQAKERTGYPTQKPLALLDRIIQASTNPEDIVLDPFAGCATTCIAAQRNNRQWIGIDISPKAAELTDIRMAKELGIFHKCHRRNDIPARTDLGDIPRYDCAANKDALYGAQGGDCACGHHFPKRNMTIDHITPRSKGGTDHISNLQLLCNVCNSTKGDRSQEYLKARLAELGVI